MDFLNIEKKWKQLWEEKGLYKFNPKNADKKYYVLEMFSYPSAANLHVGHWYNYGPADSFARFKKMQGYELFHPIGFDAFGLPAENYAIKTGTHPEISTLANIEYMEKQLKAIGASYDWDYEIKTCMPDYYKWTQWLFLQLYKNGLAYRKEAPVNWCNHCNTVLANEQVLDGHCERCENEVVKKNLVQWFFKITDYAEELLSDLENLDWPEKTKAMQRNWIGKSVGGEVEFTFENGEAFRVFTTRADTLFGVSYVVLAPENELVDKYTSPEYRQAVADYREMSAKSTEIERLSTAREKTGVFIGAYAINPANGERVPVYISDYVLASYGTGAVMGVPAHDERDFIFATKYKLPIKRVIKSKDGSADDLPYTDYGVIVDSGEFCGMASEEGKSAILEKLEKDKKGGKRINYRLRDWLVSRQRYWGCPIPIIHCEHCGQVPVPENELPVLLPKDVDFTPDGKSPLSKSESFINVPCPVCGKPAKRDADTLDTFVCSSWYFLRYPDANNATEAFNTDIINKMLPVDKYIGGAEHACMHLLYARFFTKALRDLGYVSFGEPFKSLVHQGTILGPDGQKMSKSRGNIINPNDYVEKFGSDSFRMYLMFGFNYTDGGPWNANGIDSISRFLERIEKLVALSANSIGNSECGTAEKDLNFIRHNTIKRVTADLESFSFNTAVARLMEYVNALQKYSSDNNINAEFFKACIKDLILLLAPFAPHVAEEFNEMTGCKTSVYLQSFPVYEESALLRDEYSMAVQVNSRNRGSITVPADADNAAIEALAKQNEGAKRYLDGANIKKVIVIPKRLINFVTG